MGIIIDDHLLEEVTNVKKGIFEFFQKHFQRKNFKGPLLLLILLLK